MTARLGTRAVLASYADIAVAVAVDDQPRPGEILILNGGGRDRVLLDTDDDLGPYAVTVNDSCGTVLRTDLITLDPGVHQLPVPAGGTAHLRRA